VNVDPSRTDAGLPYWICLDRRVHSDNLPAPTYDAVLDRTSYTLPYMVPSTIFAAASQDGPALFSGEPAQIDSYSMAVVRLKGNTTLQKLYFGLPYRFRNVMSKLVPRKQTRTGETIIGDGRLQLRYFELVHGKNNVNLMALVQRKGRPDYTMTNRHLPPRHRHDRQAALGR
jgi:hypothetical protein